MGTSGDHATPAGAVPRSLFKKQSAHEAHQADYGVTGTPDGRSPSRRPAAAPHGAPPRSEPRSGDSVSENETSRSLFRKNTLDEMTVRRTETPAESTAPVRREKVGIGSYEDPVEVKRKGRRKNKTGRPGR